MMCDVLAATKRRFEQRCRALWERRNFWKINQRVFAWYQFSWEGNTVGLRLAYWSGGRGPFSLNQSRTVEPHKSWSFGYC